MRWYRHMKKINENEVVKRVFEGAGVRTVDHVRYKSRVREILIQKCD